MDVANEILDAIEIIVDKKIREQATQIYSGICKNVNGDSCVMFINGKNNTVQFYGPAPIVGAIYKVFVPYGNMSSAFVITGIVTKSDDEDDKKDLYYSNPNPLDNWYFGNPVNQRGQVKYTDSWAYSIDRWLCGGDGKVTIADGHCVFYGAVDQGLSVEMSDILGCTMTASLLLTDGTLITGTAVNTDNSIEIPFVTNVGGVFIALNATDLSKHRRFRTYMGPERAVIAAKLELGSQQTLAHQDADGNWVLNEIPDYGEQLARCQRYFQLYSAADKCPAKAVDCRPVMRADPSQGTIVIGSTTYYYNTAEL